MTPATVREAIRQAAVFCECLTDDTCDRITSAVIRAAVDGMTDHHMDVLALRLRDFLLGPMFNNPTSREASRAALVSALAGGGET